jgi:hypothetical protein
MSRSGKEQIDGKAHRLAQRQETKTGAQDKSETLLKSSPCGD